MKVASYIHAGKPSYGLVKGDSIYDLGGRLASRYADLHAVLKAGALNQLEDAASNADVVAEDSIEYVPLLPKPGKIFCIGLNYKSHVAETKRPDAEYPSVFIRFADSQVGHKAAVLRPSFSTRFDYEGELAVVIGRGGRHIKEADALAHIAGFSCYNDVTVRDWQRHTHQWAPGKNFPGTGAFGPALVTPDEIPDLAAVTLTTLVNGEEKQKAPIGDLIFTIPVIISYLSKFTPLSPGDVIATGTPGGVGDRRDPPDYMKDGDVVEVIIDHVGTLRNHVELDASADH